jgi:hypothetical protein
VIGNRRNLNGFDFGFFVHPFGEPKLSIVSDAPGATNLKNELVVENPNYQ